MFSYFPIIKTKDAELKAYEMLDETIKNSILPTFEITKSRLSSKNPEMSVDKRLQDLSQILGNRPFIMDLTSERKYTNPEIESILLNKNNNGFKQWAEFTKKCITEYRLNPIPILHYNIIAFGEVKKEIENLSSHPYLAIRIYMEDGEIIFNILEMLKTFIDISKIILILDYGYRDITKDAKRPEKFDHSKEIIENINKIKSISDKWKGIIYAFSSFPASVAQYGQTKGKFPISEFIISQALKNKQILHGDYASIHPLSYDSFGAWWPRIDYIYENNFKYYRVKSGKDASLSSKQAYIKVAQHVVQDNEYKPINRINTWGDNEISECSKDNPSKVNPSHWISVRMNIYMTKQVLRLSQKEYHNLPPFK